MNFVYAIQSESFVKIGVSNDPKKRVGKVSADCPLPVRLLGFVEGGFNLESELHRRFAEYHHKGEWFELHGEVLDWVHTLPPLVKIVPADSLSALLKANRGMQTRLAARLGVNPAAVSQWKSVPPEHVLPVEEFTGISRHELRPDVFGPAAVSEDAA